MMNCSGNWMRVSLIVLLWVNVNVVIVVGLFPIMFASHLVNHVGSRMRTSE